MKWSLQQLGKIQDFPYHFSESLDLEEELKHVEDIYGVKTVNITGTIHKLGDETYRFVYHISTVLILQCALTLDPVDYEFENDYDEIYSTEVDDDFYLIEKNTIDTSIMAMSNIIIDKPINVTRPDAYQILKERGIELNDTIEEDEEDEVISYSDGLEDSQIEEN